MDDEAEVWTASSNSGLQEWEDALHVGATVDGKYRLVRKIGEGTRGWVWEAEPLNGSVAETVAVKFSEEEWDYEGEKWLVASGLAGTAAFPRVDAVLTNVSIDGGKPYWHCLAMELCGPTVEDTWEFYCGREDCVRELAKTLLETLVLLHKAGGMHCDLKPSNICEARPPAVGWRLLDWNLMWMGLPGHGFRGTWGYQSPEMLLGQEWDGKVDVWGLGVMLSESFLGSVWGDDCWQLFHEYDEMFAAADIVEQIQGTLGRLPKSWGVRCHYSGDPEVFFNRFPSLLADFLQQALSLDPATRPDAASISAHPWLANAAQPETRQFHKVS